MFWVVFTLIGAGWYPVLQGMSGGSFQSMATYALILAVASFFWGPKSSDVPGKPSKMLMFLFALIGCSGFVALAFGLGYLLGG